MSNDGDRQKVLRTSTGKALDYNGDWMAKFDANGIAAGTFNERMIAFINVQLSASYTEINSALRAYAIAQTTTNAKSFNELGPFTIVGG